MSAFFSDCRRSAERLRRPGLLPCALALCATLALPARAQDTASGLGRLFFTPERRQSLDRQRQFNIQEKQDVPEDPTFTINGMVTRSSGKRTVWINGVAQSESDPHSAAGVTTGGQTPGQVVIHSTGVPARQAKVGTTVNRNTGETSDLIGGGRIDVRHTTPPSNKDK